MLVPLPRFVQCLLLAGGVTLAGRVFATPDAVASGREGTVQAAPLAERSGPQGASLFTTLSPEATGVIVENRYADPRMWGARYREFTLGAIGTGLAAGDYDGDGRVDLYVISKTERSRLFRNLGGWKFADVTEAAGLAFAPGEWTQGAAFADVNNDGLLDLYICRFGAPNLLYINQGDGTFHEEAAARGLAVIDASGMAAFADYDRDGWLDVYLQTNVLDIESRPTGQPDYLFRNRGDGTFEDVTAPAGVSGPTQGHSATWWDFNGDGWPDLYIANDFKDPDTLYRNNRDGTFTNVLSWVVPHTPHSSMGADLGDVNNDGHIDLLIADMAATTRVKDHRGMAKLRAGLHEPEPAHPNAAQQYMHNALFLGTGTGRVQEAAFLAGLDATDWTWTVRLEDLDNDGWLDAYFTNGMVRELHQTDLVNRMMAHESIGERVRLMKSSPRLDERNLAFRNRGDLDFENMSAAWGLDHEGVSFGAVFADFDGDGDLDLAFSNYEAGVTLCRNDSNTGNRLLIDLRGIASNRFGVGARVEVETSGGRQVRELVLARGYLSTSEPVLHFGLGEAPAAERVTIRWPSGVVQVLESLAANHRHTIVEPDAGSNSRERERTASAQFADIAAQLGLQRPAPEPPYDEFRRQPLLPMRQNPFGPAVAFADLDGDGRDDLIIGGTTGDRAQLFSNLGGGSYLAYGASLFSEATRTPDAMALLIEVNGDSRPDLLLAQGGVTRPPNDPAYTLRLFLNIGDGRFGPASPDALPPLTISAGPLAAADIDRDGDLDVVMGGRAVPGSYPAPADSVLLLNDNGRFHDATATMAPQLRQLGVVNSVLFTDVDQDGWPDLLIAREWDSIVYLHNNGGRGFTDRSKDAGFSQAGAGFWRSLAAADLNGDARLDYVAGNIGLNTRYRASPERPALLFRGPFGGREQIIEAAYPRGDDRLYPLATREQLMPLVPGLAKKFPTAEAYSRATLEEVFGAEWLATAQRYAVTELQHGVFFSRPSGSFIFSPLPRVAQLAPIHGLAAGDFTGDGRADIALVGNSHAPTAPVGRFDGGIGGLLAGDGRGQFKFVHPAASGIVVPFDARALGVTDFDEDGWPDLFVTRSNERALALRNHGRGAAARSFAVTLRGPGGNPTSFGARITVESSDGTTQTAELSAGSGYLAQSTARAFFGYSPSQPPRLIRVVWPDGRSTEHPWHEIPNLRLNAP
jgi:enediyne biosynthesis protein E4